MPRGLPRMRVLIVDDSTADRKLCKLLLAKRYGRDIEFIDAADGAAALALCQAATPDCILLEYVLPDMTGLEFLALLRGVPAIGGDIGGSVAVVMLSDLS